MRALPAVESPGADGGDYEKHADDDDFVQPSAPYRDVMNDTDGDHLVTNIVAHASDVRSRDWLS